jgi:hypothetical protein
MGEVVKIRPGFQWSKTIWSGVRTTLYTLGGIAVAAIWQAVSDPATLSILLGQAKVPAGVAIIISGAIAAYNNRRKNKDK